jgi:thymidylate kinase
MTLAINIRGTGGSGKSTLVKRIMELFSILDPQMTEGRKRRMGTRLFTNIEKPAALYVPGHYDTACGGCDTIKTPDMVYDLVKDSLGKGTPVLYEGIMIMDDVTRAVALDKSLKDATGEGSGQLYVIWLNTPIEVCLDAIRNRRAARGNERPFSEKNTRQRYDRCLGGLRRLESQGVRVERLDREAAFLRVRELLAV